MKSEYFIALVADGVPFDSVAHRVRDIDPDEVRVNASESGGRTLITIVTDVDDPGIAVLQERTWCHVSRELADGTMHHVGQGWIDPLTLQSQDEDLVSMEVMCSPRDWDGAVAAALAPLKVLPGFEPLLVDPAKLNEPAEILDGYSRLVHCHPSTHAMSVVDIFGVGLPVVEIADPDWPGPQADATSRPVQRVDVTVTAEWLERRSGLLIVGPVIQAQFENDRANTLTADAFESGFPKAGSTINGDSGYRVSRSTLTRFDPALLSPAEAADYPITAGPVHGSSGVYNYVTDPNLTLPEAQEIMLDRAWYDLELDIEWSVAQKRVQTVSFSLVNGAPTAIGGSVEKLDLKTQDITVDSTTPAWEPDRDYEVDEIARVGTRNWRCTRAHHSLGTFSADMFYSLGGGAGYGQNWSMEPVDASPLGRTDATSFFHLPRGQQTLQAAALKGRAILAASIRNRPYRFETELTDELLSLTTAHVVRVPCHDQPSGWLEAKVTELEIISTPEDETLRISIAPAGGSGVVVAGADPLSQTGEDWDRIVFGDISDQQPEALPAVGGTVRIDNDVDAQLAYVSEHDYSPADGRTDPKENDPVELLRDVPTTVVLALTQLSGRDAMVHEIALPIAAPWAGPKQHGG